ncbi:unnamed protein product [Lota lota]
MQYRRRAKAQPGEAFSLQPSLCCIPTPPSPSHSVSYRHANGCLSCSSSPRPGKYDIVKVMRGSAAERGTGGGMWVGVLQSYGRHRYNVQHCYFSGTPKLLQDFYIAFTPLSQKSLQGGRALSRPMAGWKAMLRIASTTTVKAKDEDRTPIIAPGRLKLRASPGTDPHPITLGQTLTPHPMRHPLLPILITSDCCSGQGLF